MYPEKTKIYIRVEQNYTEKDIEKLVSEIKIVSEIRQIQYQESQEIEYFKTTHF